MIKNIIFDLGNVLVNVHPEKFKENLFSQNIDGDDFQNLLNAWDNSNILKAFQTGKRNTNEFLKFSTRRLNHKITQIDFKKHYNNIFSEITQMKQLLSKLSKRKKYKLILLSNTDPLHYNFIRNKFPYINLFDCISLSYKIGYLKPDKRIFRRLINTLKIKSSQSVFVDDLKDNCNSAKELGFITIHYKNYKLFLPEFELITNNNH